mmetsp:Transcript_31356/g.100325  ORF Transcript_31356/g.100325 Transcript_31356/m.100325 type:complete len:267 (+) Transcript_31356:105-905(+)
MNRRLLLLPRLLAFLPALAVAVRIELLRQNSPGVSRCIPGIRSLQQENTVTTSSGRLTPSEAAAEGFVTLQHEEIWLHQLSEMAPQAVALASDSGSEAVIAYSLTVSPSTLRRDRRPESRELCTIYEPFFSMIESLQWRGAALTEADYVLGGQCCVAKSYRRQGLMTALYDAQAAALAQTGVSAIATAIDLANVPSVRAHMAAGFVEIGRFDYSLRPSEVGDDAAVGDHGSSATSTCSIVDSEPSEPGNMSSKGWSLVLRPTNSQL